MTATQLELDLSPLTPIDHIEHESLADRFERFHQANPHVADALEALADSWLLYHDRVGMKMLVETARWRSGIATRGDAWRLNNSWTAFYARLLIERRPEWSAAIELRVQKAAA